MKPIFVAIDTAELESAVSITTHVRDCAGGVKLGLEFFAAQGPRGVRTIAQLDVPIFLDLKLHDIPHTVSKAVAALAPLEPAILTVHASGGQAMLAAAKAAAPPGTQVVAVTVLTSLDEADLASTGVPSAPGDQVVRLAMLARDSGVDGIVCSGAEVAIVRGLWPEATIIVPGCARRARTSPTRSAWSARTRRLWMEQPSLSLGGRSRARRIPHGRSWKSSARFPRCRLELKDEQE